LAGHANDRRLFPIDPSQEPLDLNGRHSHVSEEINQIRQHAENAVREIVQDVVRSLKMVAVRGNTVEVRR
jgi:hypothetical protein